MQRVMENDPDGLTSALGGPHECACSSGSRSHAVWCYKAPSITWANKCRRSQLSGMWQSSSDFSGDEIFEFLRGEMTEGRGKLDEIPQASNFLWTAGPKLCFARDDFTLATNFKMSLVQKATLRSELWQRFVWCFRRCSARSLKDLQGDFRVFPVFFPFLATSSDHLFKIRWSCQLNIFNLSGHLPTSEPTHLMFSLLELWRILVAFWKHNYTVHKHVSNMPICITMCQ